TREEFKRALWKLRERGFSDMERDEVENVFRGDIHESGSSSGISSDELKKGLHYLKHHPENHHLSRDEIQRLEETLKHYL
ncbi:MAG: hypothetical protein COV91_03190, partial [Candidatus Taylorbacteria bacterium CG11_big_fil_rev_8_21_14_0_20_46_11]